MKLSARLTETPWGMKEVIKTEYYPDEKTIEIFGEKFALVGVERTLIDGQIRHCDITLRQIITPQSIDIIVKL